MTLICRRALSRILVLLAVAALAGSTTSVALAASGHQYPTSLRHVFVRTCSKAAADASHGKLTKKQATSYCTSAFLCIQRHLTVKQFAAVVRKMQSGAANPNARVFTNCEKAAVKKLK